MSFDELSTHIGSLSDHLLFKWVEALGIPLVIALVLRLVVGIADRRLSRLAETTKTHVDDLVVALLRRTHTLFLFAVGAAAAVWMMELPDKVEAAIRTGVWLVGLVQVGIWATTVVRHVISQRFTVSQDPAIRSGSGVLTVAGLVLVWATVLLLALDNIGVDITALIAGLGIGGVAIALATQNILGDLFASVSILLDKPFVVGDFIVVGDTLGTVEHIGIKTTRLRSLSGEQLVCSNNDLLQSRIRNYKRMQERRVVLPLGVVYQTPPEKLARIPQLLRGLVESLPDTRFDRSHFSNYGSSALEFETVFFVLSADYNRYMDLRQQLNLEIFRVFQSEGIEFAYPTQTLFISQDSSRPAAEPALKSA